MTLPAIASGATALGRASPTLLGLLNLLLEGRSASEISEVRKDLAHLIGDQGAGQLTEGPTFEDTDPNAPGVQLGIDFEELQEHLENERAARGCGCRECDDGCF